jgi:predicted ribosomally synthesized peptide with SipW-like signal peptide
MNKKIMGTLAILIIALSIAGIVYAHWSDTATIKGTVHMGSVTFGFTDIIGEWDAEDYYNYPANKRTAKTVCTLSDEYTDVHTDYTVYKTLTFSMVNATPEYWGINKFTLDNGGTIPVKIQGITLILPAGLYYYQYDSIVWDVYNTTTGDFLYEIWLYNETADVDYVRVHEIGNIYAPPWDVWEYIDLVGD